MTEGRVGQNQVQMNVDVLTAYLRALIEPLVPRVPSHDVMIDHAPDDSMVEHTWRVRVPAAGMRFVLGTGGATAEAIRCLLRAHSGALTWPTPVMVDVRIRQA